MMRIFILTFAWLLSLPLLADEPAKRDATPSAQPSPAQGWFDIAPTPYGPVMQQQAAPPPYRDYQMNRILTPEEKHRWRQITMPMMANMMQMDAREAMNYFAVKYRAKAGLSFDDVVQSMMLRANRVNLKHVGTNQISRDFKAILNDTSAPRVEVFSFCDISVGRDLLRIIPEVVVFLPCRIAVMEDADKNIWVMTLDWDLTWLDLAGKQLDITPELRQGVMAIREKLDSVMRAGANGDL